MALFIAALTSSTSATEQPVYFSLVVSSSPAFNTLEIIPAVNRTLEFVHRNITPPGYHLQYSQVLDVQVSIVLASIYARIGVHACL